MPGRAGRWDGSLTRRPARRPSGVAVWGFCKSLKEKYKKRNVVERLFRRIKGFRRVCTRYDKTDVMFMAFVRFAFIMIWLN
jgi:transposase